MKRSINSIVGFTMGAIDGEIGEVKEFYFDDETWTVRYLIVETGGWLFGRKVLIAPQALLTPDWDGKTFPVNLTKEQIKNSPDIDTEKPVSRQQEVELYTHYPWGNYWGGGLWAGGMGVSGMMMPINEPFEDAIEKDDNIAHKSSVDNPHLQSTKTVASYNVVASDGKIGDIEDFIIEDSTWKISFMVIDTGHWFPGKKVIISPGWVKEMSWTTSEVVVNATVEEVKNSPEYQPSEQISESYESNLQNYYGRLISHKQ